MDEDNFPDTPFQRWLAIQRACGEARVWVGDKTVQQAWAEATEYAWMKFLIGRLVPLGVLTLPDGVGLCSCGCGSLIPVPADWDYSSAQLRLSWPTIPDFLNELAAEMPPALTPLAPPPAAKPTALAGLTAGPGGKKVFHAITPDVTYTYLDVETREAAWPDAPGLQVMFTESFITETAYGQLVEWQSGG